MTISVISAVSVRAYETAEIVGLLNSSFGSARLRCHVRAGNKGHTTDYNARLSQHVKCARKHAAARGGLCNRLPLRQYSSHMRDNSSADLP